MVPTKILRNREMKKISILIPTYNAEKDIKALLSGLKNQELRANETIEIIVVDSSSTDETVSIIKEHFPEVIVKVIENSKFNHGGTRNYLASLASGNFLLFMTQDAIPADNHLISRLLDPFENENVYISYARQIPKSDANDLEVFARSFNYPDKDMIKGKENLKSLGIKTFFNSNVCSMCRRDAFYSLGGFPQKVILNEDLIFASKVILSGFYVVYCSNAKVYHSHNYGLVQQFKRYFDIGMAFNETKYLLQYVSNEKEGFRMVVEQQKFLIKKGKVHLMPIAVLEAVVKFVAYNFGKRYNYLPQKVIKKISAYTK